MSNEQAVKILKEEKSWESEDRKIEAFNLAIEALEKQIPMKVHEIHVDEYICPKCLEENGCEELEVTDGYCPKCGQRLMSEANNEENT